MKFEFAERTVPVQASLFESKKEKVVRVPEIEQGEELENYKRRYVFAKDLYGGSKAADASNLLTAIDMVIDFIDLKASDLPEEELLRIHNVYIDQCNQLMQFEKTRNGLFTIGLIGGDIGRIYDLRIE